MLWISGTMFLVIWFILCFPLHKSGMVHTLLMIAVTLYVIQFVQDRRTRAHKAAQRSHGPQN